MTREQELAFSILCSQNGWHKARIRESETEIRNLIHDQAKQIEALRGFAQAVLIDGAYGFDPERLPKIAVNFGLITSKAVNHGSTGFECPVIYTEKTSLLTGR